MKVDKERLHADGSLPKPSCSLARVLDRSQNPSGSRGKASTVFWVADYKAKPQIGPQTAQGAIDLAVEKPPCPEVRLRPIQTRSLRDGTRTCKSNRHLGKLRQFTSKESPVRLPTELSLAQTSFITVQYHSFLSIFSKPFDVK